MVSWPASLPQQFVGMADTDDEAVTRQPMDAGPASSRRRFTAFTRTVTVPLILTGTQRQTFDTFFRTTLKSGSLAFDWEDPVTDATVEMKFKKPVKWTLTRGGTAATRIWRGTMELEIQP